jgi:hypothetical protein
VKVRIDIARNPMNRYVYVLIALMLLLPLLYVIFFTQFIPFVLRQLGIGRSTSDVKVIVDDVKQEPDVIIPDEVIKAPKKKKPTSTNQETE